MVKFQVCLPIHLSVRLSGRLFQKVPTRATLVSDLSKKEIINPSVPTKLNIFTGISYYCGDSSVNKSITYYCLSNFFSFCITSRPHKSGGLIVKSHCLKHSLKPDGFRRHYHHLSQYRSSNIKRK